MSLTFVAFLQGLAAVLGALLLRGVVVPPASGVDTALMVYPVCLGLGVLLFRNPAGGAGGRLPAFPPAATVVFAAALIPAAFVADGAGSGLSRALFLIFLAAVAGFSAGGLLRALVLYCAVPKTFRLHLSGAALAGAALGLPGTILLARLGCGPKSELIAVLMLLAVSHLLPACRSARLSVPAEEPCLSGFPTSLGALFTGLACGGLLRDMSGLLKSGALAVDERILWGGPLAALAAGSVATALVAGRVRRAGVFLGAACLLAAGALGLTGSLLLEPPPADLAGRVADLWGLVPTSGPVRDLVVSLTLFGAPFALLGCGLVPIVRLNAAVPPGTPVTSAMAPGERPAPDGAALRVALLLIGLAVGPLLLGGAWLDADRTAVAELLIVLAGGGLLLVVFDPLAGAARKAGVVCVAGGVAGWGLVAWI